MQEHKISKRSELQQAFRHLMFETPDSNLPQKIVFQESLAHRIYTITIDVEEADEFVDKNGNKWRKVEE